MRHIQGDSRHQSTLLPDRLDDYVAEDHPARVIDAFIDSLDMVELGFTQATTQHTGRKPYHPADLLKLFTYGYLNQLRSSRRLEKECHRNLELLWLMKRLAPDHKTIANFRKQNSHAIQAACRSFIQFCQNVGLLSGALIAIDGSKFRAAASRDQVITRRQLPDQRQRLDKRIRRYLELLEQNDRQEQAAPIDRQQVSKALERLKQQQQVLNAAEAAMTAEGKKQHCSSEPDARLMRSGREGMVVGYNIQSAVDSETGLIVHHDVTDDAGDNQQLLPMAEATKAQLDVEQLNVIADAGYSNGEQLNACEAQGITATVPSNRAINNQGAFYQKSDFTYDAEQNQFTCPAGKTLSYQTVSKKKKIWLYARTGCGACPQQSSCTKADKRWISRHFYEAAFERSEARLQAHPGLMSVRMAIVERPFAILKQVMGLRRLQCWGIEGAKSEIGLAMLGYNLKRMMNYAGVKRLLAAL